MEIKKQIQIQVKFSGRQNIQPPHNWWHEANRKIQNTKNTNTNTKNTIFNTVLPMEWMKKWQNCVKAAIAIVWRKLKC